MKGKCVIAIRNFVLEILYSGFVCCALRIQFIYRTMYSVHASSNRSITVYVINYSQENHLILKI